MMEAGNTSETSINLYQSTRHDSPEDRNPLRTYTVSRWEVVQLKDTTCMCQPNSLLEVSPKVLNVPCATSEQKCSVSVTHKIFTLFCYQRFYFSTTRNIIILSTATVEVAAYVNLITQAVTITHPTNLNASSVN